MPTISEADEFTETVDYPGDGDDADQASLEVFLQALTNRTNWLWRRIISGGLELVQPVPLVMAGVSIDISGNPTWVHLDLDTEQMAGFSLRQEALASAGGAPSKCTIALPTPAVRAAGLYAPVLTKVRVYFSLLAHAALPATQPAIEVWRKGTKSEEVQIGDTVQFEKADVTAYNSIGTSGISYLELELDEAIIFGTYFLKIYGEADTGAEATKLTVEGVYLYWEGAA